ncbi:MAG: STAS domain-containing protein [Bacteroidales bacterium]|jgi:anti-sigma B factor antagonist|nr:STAS domain-containing protein [Bacteroidales bacterium]
MEVKIENNGTTTIVKIIGRLDTVNSGQFEKDITPVKESDMKDVILDCSEFQYISSSGLRQFLTLQKTAQAKGGKMRIKNMKEDIKKVFDITGFTQLFDFI